MDAFDFLVQMGLMGQPRFNCLIGRVQLTVYTL